MSLATKTGQVNYRQKGAQGDRGATLRGPMAWDDMPAGFPFQSGAEGEQFIDIVVKDGAYYQCEVSHAKAEGNGPGSNYGYWGVASQLSFVATQLLLATYALIENLGVRYVELGEGGYIVMKDEEGGILFQVKDGNVTCNTGTFNDILVQSGRIASFVINGQQMVAESEGGQSMLLSPTLIRFLGGGTQVYIGSEAVPGYSGMSCPLRVQMAGGGGSLGTTNTAFYVDVSGASEEDKDTDVSWGNHAFYIPRGDVVGLRPKLRRVATSQTLGKMDYYVACVNTSDIRLVLPGGCEDGQTIWICSVNRARVTVATTYPDDLVNGGNEVGTSAWHAYVYDAYNHKWLHAWMNQT